MAASRDNDSARDFKVTAEHLEGQSPIEHEPERLADAPDTFKTPRPRNEAPLLIRDLSPEERQRLETALRRKIDPRRVNGGVFLGLDGIVIKSHGGADAEGFAGAIDIGYDMVRHALLDRTRETLTLSEEHRDVLAERGAQELKG